MNVEETICAFFIELRPDLEAEPEQFYALPLRRLISSIEMLDLLAFLEERFGVTIPDDEVTPEHFYDLPAIVRFIQGKAASGDSNAVAALSS